MFYLMLILSVTLVIVLWLCYEESDSYLLSGLILGAAIMKSHEGWGCFLIVLTFIMLLWREYNSKNSILRPLNKKILRRCKK
ncbi:hypothetical protein D4R42_04160 [bacterium]|nr:MAG: hypothetical protein D4R42_04160 [bacterium]